jgi:hypothetical protein
MRPERIRPNVIGLLRGAANTLFAQFRANTPVRSEPLGGQFYERNDSVHLFEHPCSPVRTYNPPPYIRGGVRYLFGGKYELAENTK